VKRPPETVYRGERLTDGRGRILGVRVTVNGERLDPRPSQRLWNHSPTGYEWGYAGSGPAQLALALVLDATGDPAVALRTYQWFKFAAVACWDQEWEVTAGRIQEWVEQATREGGQTPEGGHTPEVDPHPTPLWVGEAPAVRPDGEGGAP
jgi:hypothetical protein